MPLAKPIIDIAINDGAFKNFYAMFEKYKSALGEMPAGWKAVGDEMGKTGTMFEQMLAAMMAQKAITEAISEEEKRQADEAERKRKAEAAAQRSGVLHWKDMARTTRDVAGNIFSATTSLLKWAGIGSFLVGAGGLWGISRLAGDVASGRRSSQGLGLSYGEQKSFDINYGSVVDGGAFLGAINNALHSGGDRGGLIRAGLSGSELEGSTADVGNNLLNHLKQIADNTNPAFMVDRMKAQGLDQFVSLEEMMRIRAMTGPEFETYQKNNAFDKKDLDLSRDTQSAWMQFTQQMDRAGEHIENTFAKSLVALAPNLKELSVGFMKLIDAVATSPVIQHWIDELAKGLGSFADTVGTPEFQKKVEDFVKVVGKLVDGAWRFAKFFLPEEELGSRPSDSQPVVPTDNVETRSRKERYKYKDVASYDNSAMHDIVEGVTSLWDKFQKPKDIGASGETTQTAATKLTTASVSPFLTPIQSASNFTDVERRHKLTPGILQAMYEVESSSGRDSMSPAGAIGPFQFMPKTAKDMGVNNPMDLGQSSEGAGKYLEMLMKEFKGDIAKAVAAYNWGASNVHKAEAAGGSWVDHVPAETKSELARVLSRLAAASTTKITIDNLAGANITTQAAQVAQ